MIITKDPIQITRSQPFEEIFFGIRQDALAMVLETLRDLYSDPILALVREYSANAYDSHLESGKVNVPIEVTLPNRFEPVLKIKDTGLGLSHEEIKEVFVFYAASGDKKNRDDTIGGFGIGGKSAFAYGDTFIIESIHDKIKTIYNAYIDETRIGKMAVMDSGPSDEPNGVTIKIPVKPADIPEFRSAAEKVFEFWSVKPIFNGTVLDIPDRKYLLEGDNWGIYSFDERRHTAVVNQIPYDIRLDFISDYGELSDFKNLGMVFHFDYDDVEVSKNRESIKLTDQAKKNVEKLLGSIKKDVETNVVGKISQASSYVEAVRMYNDLFETDLHFRNFRHIIGEIKWKEKIVHSELSFHSQIGYNSKSKLYHIEHYPEGDRIVISKTSGKGRYSRYKAITPHSDTLLIFTKSPPKDTYLRDVIGKNPDKKIYAFYYEAGDSRDNNFDKVYEDLRVSYDAKNLEDFEPIRYKGASGPRGPKAKINVDSNDYRVHDKGRWKDFIDIDFEDDSMTFITFNLFRNETESLSSGNAEHLLNVFNEYIGKNDLSNTVKIIGVNKSVRYKFKKVKTVTPQEYYVSILKDIKKHNKQYSFNVAKKRAGTNIQLANKKYNRLIAYKGVMSQEGRKSLRVVKFLKTFATSSIYLTTLENIVYKIYKKQVEQRVMGIQSVIDKIKEWDEKHPILESESYAWPKDEILFFYIELIEKELDKQEKADKVVL